LTIFPNIKNRDENMTCSRLLLTSRFRVDPGKPGKSWNFIVVFSRTENRLLGLESSVNLLNLSKKHELQVWQTERRISIEISGVKGLI